MRLCVTQFSKENGSCLHEPSQLQAVLKAEGSLQPFAEQADERTVDQRADDRAKLDALKMSEAEESKGQDNAGKAAAAVIDRFHPADVLMILSCQLLDEKLIGLRRDVGMKQHCYARRAEEHAQKVAGNAEKQPAARHQRDQREHKIQHRAVNHCRDEGEEVSPLESAHDQTGRRQNDGLQDIFRHAEGVPRKNLRQLQMQNVGRSDHHGHTEVRPLHQRRPQRQCKNSQKIGKLGVKHPFRFHISSSVDVKSPFDTETEKARYIITKIPRICNIVLTNACLHIAERPHH